MLPSGRPAGGEKRGTALSGGRASWTRSSFRGRRHLAGEEVEGFRPRLEAGSRRFGVAVGVRSHLHGTGRFDNGCTTLPSTGAATPEVLLLRGSRGPGVSPGLPDIGVGAVHESGPTPRGSREALRHFVLRRIVLRRIVLRHLVFPHVCHWHLCHWHTALRAPRRSQGRRGHRRFGGMPERRNQRVRPPGGVVARAHEVLVSPRSLQTQPLGGRPRRPRGKGKAPGWELRSSPCVPNALGALGGLI